MLDEIPNSEKMVALIGQPLFEIWTQLCTVIYEKYDIECIWNKGGKAWVYEYKYRRGRKNLVCAICKRKLHRFYDYFWKR